ncbi:MAG TPA: hypothetical protein VM431_11345 [Phycisphaerae bacterium]|nr:hypothetical protein [Phycisphaerae bacterium]
MARWQRDPKARRNVAYVLAAAEAVALTANFYSVFSAYLLQLDLRLSGRGELLMSLAAVYYTALAATAVCLGVSVFVGVMYARARSWARKTFIAANVVLVGLGVVWFVKNRLGGGSPDTAATLAGLLLPIITLFPLLWPLIVFRPDRTVGAEV